MVTWPMTSRDAKNQGHETNIFGSSTSQRPCEIDGQFKLTTYGTIHCQSNGQVNDDVM